MTQHRPDLLNEHQKEFCKRYLKTLNAAEAYREMHPGCKDTVAASQGRKWLSMPKIRAAIQVEMDKRAKRLDIEPDRVLQEIAKLAFSDVQALFHPNGSLKAVPDLDPVIAKAIASVEVVARQAIGRPSNKSRAKGVKVEYVHKYRLWDKLGALEKLGKHLKLFNDNEHKHMGPNGEPLFPKKEMTDLELARKVAFILGKAVPSDGDAK